MLLAESNNDLKRLLGEMKEENAKAGLHLNMKKTNIMMTTEKLHTLTLTMKKLK